MPGNRKALTRAKVLESALNVLDTEGVAGLSMRKLAAKLNVEAMSLYNHVKDKQDILNSLVNLVLSRIEPPDPSLPWADRLEAIVFGLYGQLIQHPALVLIIASEQGRPTEGAVLRGMDLLVATLAESGLSPARQVSAFRAMLAMCFGFVLTHTQGLSMTRDRAEQVWSAWDGSIWSPDTLPNLARLAPQFLKTHADDDLRFLFAAYIAALKAPEAAPRSHATGLTKTITGRSRPSLRKSGRDAPA